MKISGFENVISIENFEYCSSVNEHETCHFTCYLKDKDVDSILKMLDSDCSFENEDFLFTGHISDFTVSKDISGTKIQVSCIGKSYLYDETMHNRIFQDANKTLSDILSKLDGISDIKHKNKDEKAIGGIILQSYATDWKFIVDMANLLGEYVFPGESTFIASYGSETIELSENELIDYEFTVSRNGAKLFCRVDKNICLGCLTLYNGMELFVHTKKYVLEHGKYYFEYFFVEKKAVNKDLLVKNNALLVAKVKDNADPDRMGRIQVEFTNNDMEDCMSDNAVWIRCKSLYATKDMGISFIPSINDSVLVKIFNGDAVVLGSLRTEAYNESIQNINSKYIAFDKDVFIEYSEGKYIITNKKNICSISQENAIITIGDKTQIIMESGKIVIKADKSSIEIKDDIKSATGRIIIEAKNEASISSSNVNIKGQSGVSIN